MSKIAVVYWSGTGNTEAMANLVAEGATSAGAETEVIPCADFSADRAADYDAFAFGCPAMGSEVLEEMDFQPMFDACKNMLSGKRVALFGSFGWGDGQWMRDWAERTKKAGAILAADPLIVNLSPDADGKAKCRELGKALADA